MTAGYKACLIRESTLLGRSARMHLMHLHLGGARKRDEAGRRLGGRACLISIRHLGSETKERVGHYPGAEGSGKRVWNCNNEGVPWPSAPRAHETQGV
jgi:hypothetical protein